MKAHRNTAIRSNVMIIVFYCIFTAVAALLLQYRGVIQFISVYMLYHIGVRALVAISNQVFMSFHF